MRNYIVTAFGTSFVFPSLSRALMCVADFHYRYQAPRVSLKAVNS